MYTKLPLKLLLSRFVRKKPPCDLSNLNTESHLELANSTPYSLLAMFTYLWLKNAE